MFDFWEGVSQMNVKIIATQNCSQRHVLQKRFKKMNVPIITLFIDENPELIQEYDVIESPNIVINGDVVYRADTGKPLPTIPVLWRLLDKKKT